MRAQSLFAEYPPAPTEEQIRKSLEEQAYVALPFSVGKLACEELFTSFTNFVELCDTPDGQQLIDAVTFNINNRVTGQYYLQYRKPGHVNTAEPSQPPGSDHKYAFHFGLQTIDRARTALGHDLPREMTDCLENCAEFMDATIATARLGARALGIEKIHFSGKQKNWVHLLRLLHYVEDGSPSLGETHFDRSAFSLAGTESRSGLRGTGGQNGFLDASLRSGANLDDIEASLRPITHEEGEAKFFLGAGYNHLLEKDRSGRYPLLAHDIQNDEPGEPRNAAVTFFNPVSGYPNTIPDSSRETGFGDMREYFRSLSAAA